MVAKRASQGKRGKSSTKYVNEKQKERLRLSSAVFSLAKQIQPAVSIREFEREANRFGFDASDYLTKGCTVLRKPVLSALELREALEVAQRVSKVVKGSQNGEFFSLRDGVSADKRKLFALLYKFKPLLHQLFGGIRLPGSDKSPYAHHNQIQLAVKQPGFQGYDKLSKMRNALVGHIDQTDGSKKSGRRYCNYTALFGIVLSGDTQRRNDAGNLWVSPGSASKFAKQFTKHGQVPTYEPGVPLAKRLFTKDEMPIMKAVRAKPGQAIVMQWQTIHGVGPNHSETDRVHVYFRLTSSGRPEGSKKSYEAAMLDPTLETPLLRELAERQRAKKTKHD